MSAPFGGAAVASPTEAATGTLIRQQTPTSEPDLAVRGRYAADTADATDPHPTGSMTAATRSVFDDAAVAAGGSIATNVANLPLASAPVLPDTVAASSPVIAEPVAAAVPDVRAVRSAQLRASRQQRQGKVFGRAVIAAILIGGLIAVALSFGRSYLFQTEWDARLVPIVDQVQQSRGAEFDQAVPVIEQLPSDFGTTYATVLFGDAWADRLPEWRALGLATGASTPETVATRVAASRAAFFDPATETIYINAAVEPDAMRDDLRLALEQAFAAQNGEAEDGGDDTFVAGFAGMVPNARLAHDAVDRALLGVQAEFDADDSELETEPLPLPLAFQIAATEEIGDEVLAAAALESTSIQVGDELPAVVTELLDDATQPTGSSVLQPGDQVLVEPTMLGLDDWALVWGSRLPQNAVDRLTETVVGDSYRVVDRGGRTCVAAVFEARSRSRFGPMANALQNWGSRAPVETITTVTELAGNRVQVEACDPEMIAGTPDLTSAQHVLDRQLARLTEG